jgi:hypothetical protein
LIFEGRVKKLRAEVIKSFSFSHKNVGEAAEGNFQEAGTLFRVVIMICMKLIANYNDD